MLSFTEDDYRGNEGDGFIELKITKTANVRLANSVSFVISPLTLADAESKNIIMPHSDNPATGIKLDM